MAGIKANTASVTMGDGDTAADQTFAGFVTGEQVTLTTTPTGSSYSWSLAKPAGSTSRSDLSDTTGSGPVFTPDVAGYYVITCVVDGSTSYVLRVSVSQIAQVTAVQALRLSPLADAAVPAPPVGASLYFSTTQNAVAIKKSDNTVHTVNTTAV